MRINQTDKYEELASEWQYQMLAILKDRLAKHGISAELSKEICGEFAFDIAMLQDQGEITVGEEEFRPVICFHDFDNELYYKSEDEFQLHDYAYGNNSELFEHE